MIIVQALSIPHFKGLGMRNLQYKISIYKRKHNKMSSYFDFPLKHWQKNCEGIKVASTRASYKWEGSDKVTTSVANFLGNRMDNEKSVKKRIYNNGILLP